MTRTRTSMAVRPDHRALRRTALPELADQADVRGVTADPSGLLTTGMGART